MIISIFNVVVFPRRDLLIRGESSEETNHVKWQKLGGLEA